MGCVIPTVAGHTTAITAMDSSGDVLVTGDGNGIVRAPQRFPSTRAPRAHPASPHCKLVGTLCGGSMACVAPPTYSTHTPGHAPWLAVHTWSACHTYLPHSSLPHHPSRIRVHHSTPSTHDTTRTQPHPASHRAHRCFLLPATHTHPAFVNATSPVIIYCVSLTHHFCVSNPGQIMVWAGSDFSSLGAFDLAAVVADRFRSATITSLSILCDHDRSSVLVATSSCDVYEVNRLTARVVLVHQAHACGGVWALAPHPTDPDVVVTCGDDRTLRLWSVKAHKQIVARQMVRGLECVC